MNRKDARRELIETYQQSGSIGETARRWHTSRRIVRKWLRRFQAEGELGLQDRSHKPHFCPQQTPPEREQQVVSARQQTGYGPLRLAPYLQRQGVCIPAGTIRHILKRHGLSRPSGARRHPLYPAHWAWQSQSPFTFIQVDAKDIHDKNALGTALCHHLVTHDLPRYQYTACEARSRLRFLAYGYHLTQDNGLAFILLCTLWMRAHGFTEPVQFQTDWGKEFGGDNPEHIATLSQRFLAPLGGSLCRYPMGRKQYNGRVERSHRSDDEEFYRPYLPELQNVQQFLQFAARWIYFYNVCRPHLGDQMERAAPLDVLHRLRYNGPDSLAAFPPILLDPISSDLLLSCDPEVGTNLLAQYKALFVTACAKSVRTSC